MGFVVNVQINQLIYSVMPRLEPLPADNCHQPLATFEWIRIHAHASIGQLERLDQLSLNPAWHHAMEAFSAARD